MSARDQNSATEVQRSRAHRDRWTLYEERSGIAQLSERLSPAELGGFEIFADCEDDFLRSISPDITLVDWQGGAILFEEGSYVDLAFWIVEGRVEISLMGGSEESSLKAPIFDAERTGMIDLESGGGETLMTPAIPTKAAESDASEIAFLSTSDYDVKPGNGLVLGAGDFFGEIGALSGWPQSVTARTVSDCRLLQIRVPALRALRLRSDALKNRLDGIYRERSLAGQLRATPLFKDCPDTFLQRLKERVELVSLAPGEILARQGRPVESLFLVRSGFVKLLKEFEGGEAAVTYLSKGMTLGEVELLIEGITGWRCTAQSVEFSELAIVSRSDLENLLEHFPSLRLQLWEYAVQRIKDIGAASRDVARSEFVETALQTGLAQATSVLLIDLQTCTRCDDCVRACADTHDGRPRFVREGERYGNFLIARSCYHCRDPVCLVGCPTGAIRRAGIAEVVEIRDEICIGCQVCAQSCPYDAIVMHDTRQRWPADALPERLRGQPRQVASKCDLCSSRSHPPACVSNCPHGCAIRVGSTQEFLSLFAEEART